LAHLAFRSGLKITKPGEDNEGLDLGELELGEKIIDVRDLAEHCVRIPFWWLP